MPKELVCFFCDGSGEICNICGESPEACECSVEDIQEYAKDVGDGPNDVDVHWGECETCVDRMEE